MIPRKILPGTLIGFALLFFCLHAAAADPPRRIVSLAPNLTEILFDLGLADRIAGVTDYCLRPPAARQKPKVGGFVNPSLEAVVALRPDLVLLTDDGNPRAVEDRLRALGIRTHVFKTGHIRDLPREIRSLGEVLAVPGRARERAETMARTFERIENRARTRGAPRIRTALFIIQPEPLIVAGKGTTMDDALTLLKDAAALHPQDRQLQDYLHSLDPGGPFEAPFVIEPADLTTLTTAVHDVVAQRAASASARAACPRSTP